MTDYSFHPGDVTLLKANITNKARSRVVNVIPQVGTIQVFESIIQPAIIAEIIFADGINLLESFPLIGEEIIEIAFRIPGQQTIDLSLNITSITDKVILDNHRGQQYKVTACSSILTNSAGRLISQRFNDDISSSIRTIAIDHLSIPEERLFLSPTTGIDNLVITNLTPLQAIDKLRSRAIDSRYQSSSFVFFEDRRGVFLLTIEQLLANAGRPKVEFFHDTNIQTDVRDNTYRDLIAVNVDQVSNTLRRIADGGSNSKATSLNLLTGEVVVVHTTATEFEQSFVKTSEVGRGQTSEFHNTSGKSPSISILATNDGNTSIDLADKVGKLQMFVSILTQKTTSVSVFGDTNLQIGDCVKLNITTANTFTGANNNRVIEGNYLISKIRHSIVNSNRPVYTQTLELISNGY